jgi:hypothetical protein
MAIAIPLLLCAALSCKKAQTGKIESAPLPVKAPDIAERLAKYAPTEIAVDPKSLSDEDRRVINKLIEAAQVLDEIYWKQTYPQGPAMAAHLKASTDPANKPALDFLLLNFGPFDRSDDNKPFLGTEKKLLGAGFYPPDLTKEEFEKYVAAHPADRAALENEFRVIKRENGGLAAVPYSIEYKPELERMAARLDEAAALTSNPSLKAYLSRRAADLVSNDYYESDCLWIDLKDNLPEIVIGPYEVYEDALLGLKASYESYVTINDFEGMKKLHAYLDHLDEMQRSLPVEQKYKDQSVKGLSSPLNVVNEVFTAGDARAGIMTSAFVLPNDERVREKKGSKKVFLKNMMEAKFSKSLVPIAARVMAPADAAQVTFDAYFIEVLLHEICHALGLNYVVLPDGTKTTVGKALRDLNTPIEEAKADVLGIQSVPLLVQRGVIPKERREEIYASYLAGMFRVMRFGAAEAHGLGVLLQFNFLREKGAFVFGAGTGKFAVDRAKIEGAVRELAARFLILEGDGDYAKAKAFIERYGVMDAPTKSTLAALADIPVDIAPIFKTIY